MGKAKPGKRSGHAAGPYDRPQKSTNIFKMNKDYGQHILKNPGVSDVSFHSSIYHYIQNGYRRY
jgi:18S rRNA (adenine1779-N6/adenine1780-N6)-dimethyltransferase